MEIRRGSCRCCLWMHSRTPVAQHPVLPAQASLLSHPGPETGTIQHRGCLVHLHPRVWLSRVQSCCRWPALSASAFGLLRRRTPSASAFALCRRPALLANSDGLCRQSALPACTVSPAPSACSVSLRCQPMLTAEPPPPPPHLLMRYCTSVDRSGSGVSSSCWPWASVPAAGSVHLPACALHCCSAERCLYSRRLFMHQPLPELPAVSMA